MDLFGPARWAFAFVLVGALVGATNADSRVAGVERSAEAAVG